MKKNLFFLLPLSLVLMFTSCEPSAVIYNDAIVKYSDDAEKRVELFTANLDLLEINENEKAKNLAKTAVDSLYADIDRINKLEKPSDANELHSATVDYVRGLSDLVAAMSNEYCKITDNTTETEYNKMEKNINAAEKAVEKKLEGMISAQKEFAKANDLKFK